MISKKELRRRKKVLKREKQIIKKLNDNQEMLRKIRRDKEENNRIVKEISKIYPERDPEDDDFHFSWLP